MPARVFPQWLRCTGCDRLGMLSQFVGISKVANDLIDEGWEVDPGDLATVTPYITSKTRRFGTWHLDMEPPENKAVGRLRMAA
ncbi:hypothetical protein [Streptomyces sp. NPDC088400]|uniref:hypothetical protein n=1 Tax=Streptomyces sp. NPDC088400 TaxID=3365861 RepID=UPI00382F215F